MELKCNVLVDPEGDVVGMKLFGVGESNAEFFAFGFFKDMRRKKASIKVDSKTGDITLKRMNEGSFTTHIDPEFATKVHQFLKQRKMIRQMQIRSEWSWGASCTIFERSPTILPEEVPLFGQSLI